MIDVTSSPYTVVDYCDAMSRGDIIVNHDYQRSPKVWPEQAKSFLIETILLKFPMPKLALYQTTDLKTRKTTKEIVDGQQRSTTIHDFYVGKLRLSRGLTLEEAAGRKFEELDDDLKLRFISYALSVDLFVGATKEDIREAFRRMNSYTVPLNAEEKRHARYQGECKWFIYKQTRKYSDLLELIGSLSEKQINRMQDAKLLSEIVHALLYGIKTTREKDLNSLYADNDREFAHGREIEGRLAKAFSAVSELPATHHTALMKPHHLYSLVLAISHFQKPVDTLLTHYKFNRSGALPGGSESALSRLAAAVEDPETEPKVEPFVDASDSRTNVAEQRRIRFQWMCRALEGKLP